MEAKYVIDFLETNNLFTKIKMLGDILTGLDQSFQLATARNTYFDKAFRDYEELIRYYFYYWEAYYKNELDKPENKEQNEKLIKHLGELMELGNIKNQWEKMEKPNKLAPRFIEFVNKLV